MVAVVSIKVQYAQALAAFAAMGQILDPVKLLNAIGLRQLRWMSDNIKGGGYPDAWTQMSENTLTGSPQRTSSHNFASRYQSQLLQGLTVELQGAAAVEVGVNAPYVDYHHEGTAPYTIRPVKARLLAFQVAGGSFASRLGRSSPLAGSTTTAFAQEVHHPGVPARPMLPSKAVAEQLAIAVLNAAVTLATKADGSRAR